MILNDIKAKAIELSIASVVGLIVGAIVTTLVWLFSDVPSAIMSLLPTLSSKVLTKLSLGLFVLVLFEAVWIYILRRRPQEKLRPCFGILWDKDANPYCPSCQKLLSNYHEGQHYVPSLRCTACQKSFTITDEEAQHYGLHDAKEFIRTNVWRTNR